MDKENYRILYICDGKEERCKDRCDGECKHTRDYKHARYGVVEGHPSWYPERFYHLENIDIWVEKEKF